MKGLDVPGIVPPVGGYSHGVIVDGPLLVVSGQTPEDPAGRIGRDPEQQLRQIWHNLSAVVRAGDAELHDIVHVRTYLSDRSFSELNTRVRTEFLRGHLPALTVVVCELFEPGWVAEIELLVAIGRR